MHSKAYKRLLIFGIAFAIILFSLIGFLSTSDDEAEAKEEYPAKVKHIGVTERNFPIYEIEYEGV